MRRVKNRGGREILINPDRITIVEPLPGEENMVVLHFGRDQKAVVRGTLDDYAAPPWHLSRGAQQYGQKVWRGDCSCGFQTAGCGDQQLALTALDKHIWNPNE